MNINDVALHFDIHKTNSLPNNHSFPAKRIGWRPPEIDQIDKNQLHWSNFLFISHKGGRDFAQQAGFAERGETVSGKRGSAVFISQLIQYNRACFSYECFILRARRLSSKLLK